MKKAVLMLLTFITVFMVGCVPVADEEKKQEDSESHSKDAFLENEEITDTERENKKEDDKDTFLGEVMGMASLGATEDATIDDIDDLWSILNGKWVYEEDTGSMSYEFIYVDNKPCVRMDLSDGYNDEEVFLDTLVYDFSVVDDLHYNAYTCKKGSYGGGESEYGPDVLLAWYSFDLSEVSEGKLILSWHTEYDNGDIQNIEIMFQNKGQTEKEDDTDTSWYSVMDSLGTTEDATIDDIDDLWSTLKGTWVVEEYKYKGTTSSFEGRKLEFEYIDNKPCMRWSYYNEEEYLFSDDEYVYDFTAVDDSYYKAYIFKKGSYGDESENKDEWRRLVWYSFDLSEISAGKLILGYHIESDKGNIDNHEFIYRIEKE